MSFRKWTEDLRKVRGNQPNWPWLLGFALEKEFGVQRAADEGYAGEVFLDRDGHPFQEGSSERRMVAGLYHLCCRDNEGRLIIGDEEFWLLGYEWPNQGGDHEKGRRADLVGMTVDGGLVVFECKRHDNDDPPFTALTEGLDYLSCLLRRRNYDRIVAGFRCWKRKSGKVVAKLFQDVEPNPTARAAVIVLAPGEYFSGRYARSKRGDGWPDLATVGDEVCLSFRIGFAVSDFESSAAEWI